MIRRLLARFRPAPVAVSLPEPTPAPRDTVSPRDVGLRDAVLDGWFLGDSGEKAEGRRMVLNWILTDPEKPTEQYALNLENSALTYRQGLSAGADVSLTLPRATLDAITLGQLTWRKAIDDELVVVGGSEQRFFELLSILDTFSIGFPIVTP